MEVILREDVPDLGIIGDIVKVKPGYARNYLLPRGLAVLADRRNRSQLEHEQGLIELKKQRERGTYERLAGSLGSLSLEIEVRAGRKGKLFGSVTNQDVHRLLAEKDFDIDRRRIDLKDPIKEIGEYKISIKVGQDISTEVPLSVKPLGGELEDESVDGEEDDAPRPMLGEGHTQEDAQTAESGSEAAADEEAAPAEDGDKPETPAE